MKYKETQYTSPKQILKFPDHYVCLTVNVSDKGVAPNAEGNKIVPAGTIVGGKGVIGNQHNAVSSVYAGATVASYTTQFSAPDSNIKYTAKIAGTGGNALQVEYIKAGNNTPLSVEMSGKKLTVNLATDGTGAITTIASDIIKAIVINDAVCQVIDAELVGDGSGLVEALVAQNLAKGADGAGGTAEGVLMNDVDVTYGPALGAMIIHGFVDITKMPIAPSAADIKALPQITFLG